MTILLLIKKVLLFFQGFVLSGSALEQQPSGLTHPLLWILLFNLIYICSVMAPGEWNAICTTPWAQNEYTECPLLPGAINLLADPHAFLIFNFFFFHFLHSKKWGLSPPQLPPVFQGFSEVWRWGMLDKKLSGETTVRCKIRFQPSQVWQHTQLWAKHLECCNHPRNRVKFLPGSACWSSSVS